MTPDRLLRRAAWALKAAGVAHRITNEGHHIRVSTVHEYLSFWPSTDRVQPSGAIRSYPCSLHSVLNRITPKRSKT